jgi:flagellum-specific peptidoglycan hydrolase FlgJ
MNQNQSEFLAKVVPAAIATQSKYGVPASITIAQAILESSNKLGWGQSTLALKANNYFGVKATDLAHLEAYIELPTHEFHHGVEDVELAKFARYASPQESFEAHARLLLLAPRYKPAMAAKADAKQFAIELQRCGYSTSPSYAVTLQLLVRDYGLEQYDVSDTVKQS